jgi:hypothetical protein
MTALHARVWASRALPPELLPRLAIGRWSRSSTGYINYERRPYRIVVRGSRDPLQLRSTLLHELAHAILRLHSTDAKEHCRCPDPCAWDAHGRRFKAHLAALEHEFHEGLHSRWGLAGCLGRTRVPAGTPWQVNLECRRARAATAP